MKLLAILYLAYIIGVQATGVPSLKTVVPEEVLFHVSDTNFGHRPFVLECVATGEDIQYKWSKNAEAFDWRSNPDIAQRQNEGSLVFLKPTNQDEGLYKCQAENKLGVTSSAAINVKKTYMNLPNITPSKFSPVNGKPFHLSCPIPEGYPKPKVQWVLQHSTDSSITDSIVDKRITLDPEGTLWFSNVTEEDTSINFKYTCMATTPAFENKPVPLAEAFIEKVVDDIGPQDGELTPQYLSKDMTAMFGEITALFCIYGGTPLAHPDWFKDGINVNNKPGDRVTRHNRSAGKRLLIRNTLYEDAGNYTCIVDNGVAAKLTYFMYLTVEGKPIFQAIPGNKTTSSVGKDVQIPCKSLAIPAPKVGWTYNSKPLEQNDHYIVTVDGLNIKNIKQSDMGIYGCKAKNDHGEIYSETALYVN